MAGEPKLESNWGCLGTIAVVIIGALASFAGRNMVSGDLWSKIFPPKVSSEIADGVWYRYLVGESGLSLEAPERPKEANVELGENVRALVKSSESFEYKTRGLEMMANAVEYIEDVDLSLEGAVEGSMSGISKAKGVTGLQWTKSQVTVYGIPGYQMTGTFKQNDVSTVLSGVAAIDGRKLWQVLVLYRSGDENGGKAARKMIESVKIFQKD